MGASKGVQSLCGHSSDSTLPLFSLQLRVHKDQYEFECARTVRLHLDALLASVQIIISSMLSPSHILILFFVLYKIGSLFSTWIYLLRSE